jgi:hypothetical protein
MCYKRQDIFIPYAGHLSILATLETVYESCPRLQRIGHAVDMKRHPTCSIPQLSVVLEHPYVLCCALPVRCRTHWGWRVW